MFMNINDFFSCSMQMIFKFSRRFGLTLTIIYARFNWWSWWWSIHHLFIAMRTISRCLFKSFNPFVIIPFQNLCPFLIHGNYIFRHSLAWWFSLWECQTWSWIFHSFSYILLLMIWHNMVWRKIKMSFTIGLALVPCQNPILKGHSKLPKRFTFSMSIPLSKLVLY